MLYSANWKSIGLDPIMDALQSPSRWPLEFEKKQQENYFFLLFKGQQADSIYMEVELQSQAQFFPSFEVRNS
jgi:centromeric protein E